MSEAERGDCAAAAVGLGRALAAEGLAVKVVHGRPLGRGGEALGMRYFHAWIEAVGGDGRTVVVDYSNGLEVTMPRAEYYRLGRIKDVRRYTLAQVATLLEEHGHLGPWDPALWPIEREEAP